MTYAVPGELEVGDPLKQLNPDEGHLWVYTALNLALFPEMSEQDALYEEGPKIEEAS